MQSCNQSLQVDGDTILQKLLTTRNVNETKIWREWEQLNEDENENERPKINFKNKNKSNNHENENKNSERIKFNI